MKFRHKSHRLVSSFYLPSRGRSEARCRVRRNRDKGCPQPWLKADGGLAQMGTMGKRCPLSESKKPAKKRWKLRQLRRSRFGVKHTKVARRVDVISRDATLKARPQKSKGLAKKRLKFRPLLRSRLGVKRVAKTRISSKFKRRSHRQISSHSMRSSARSAARCRVHRNSDKGRPPPWRKGNCLAGRDPMGKRCFACPSVRAPRLHVKSHRD